MRVKYPLLLVFWPRPVLLDSSNVRYRVAIRVLGASQENSKRFSERFSTGGHYGYLSNRDASSQIPPIRGIGR